MTINYLSVCAGIEAASVAWHALGWQAVAYSEVEPFPCAVLKHHYPDVPNWGDMTKFKDWPDAAIDLLVGGTPCQSFSVAGLRKGLDDPRGNLMLTYLAIAAKYRPAWVVWENVPGVLSSNGGRDFASLLRGLGELGYGWAYRVLDAQYFGVAQRRRRVFVVGHLGDWHRAAAVLFERHSLSGNPAPSRKAREGIAADAQGGVDSGIPATVGALTDGAHMGGGSTAKTPTQVAYLPSVANPLTARMHKGINSTVDEGQTPIVTCGGRFDAVAFDTTQVTSAANYSQPKVGDPCHPLAAGAHAPAIAIQGNLIGRDDGGPQGVGASDDGVMYTLTKADVHGVAHTLRAEHDASEDGTGRGTPLVPVAFHNRQDPDVSGDVTHPIGAKDNGMGVATVINMGGDKGGASHTSDGSCFTLSTNEPHAIAQSMQVRRLTPRECERLQGFPDDYTLIPWRGKEAPDGPRYKALGNSMAVPVMAWIGQRIDQVAAITAEQAAA